MLEKIFKVTNHTGIDAKMASAIVNYSGKFSCDVQLQIKDLTINLKSIMGVMSLNVHKGELIKVICNGADEEEAINELSLIIDNIKLGKEY